MAHRSTLSSSILFFSFFAASILSVANGHAYCEEPRPRGAMDGPIVGPLKSMMPGWSKSCIDYSSHFPAGDKAGSGTGLESQKVAAGGKWTPYDPTAPGFVFRSGVCGDLKKGTDAGAHMRGGRFYCPAPGGPPDAPYIPESSVYTQGGVLELRVRFATHHNGFMEVRVCDVEKCGGEISEECLRNANTCRVLKRTKEADCESGMSKRCGPIDRAHPTRFYLPCSKTAAKSKEVMTGIRFDLPADLNCQHCVMQWYMAAANACNPPGLYDYFTGPHGPKNWGSCPGQGGAKGGYRPNWKVCGEGDAFSEDYYSCSDIKINAAAGAVVTQPPAEPTVTPSASSQPVEEKELDTRKFIPSSSSVPFASSVPSASSVPVTLSVPSASSVPSISSGPRIASVPLTASLLLNPAVTPSVSFVPTLTVPTPTVVMPTPVTVAYTPEPAEATAAPTSATSTGPVAYVEINIGGRLFKINDGESKAFATGGATVTLSAVTFGEKPTQVLYKVESYGWKYEYVHPYTYTFKKPYKSGPKAIRIYATAADGQVYVTRFTLSLL